MEARVPRPRPQASSPALRPESMRVFSRPPSAQQSEAADPDVTGLGEAAGLLPSASPPASPARTCTATEDL